MTLENETSGEVEIVKLGERIEVNEADKLKKTLLGIINSGTNRIVIDLTKTVFVASAGIGLFATLVKTCRANGGNVAFVNPNDVVLDILRVTKLIDLFTVCNSIEAAIKEVE